MFLKDIVLSIHDGRANKSGHKYINTVSNFDYEVPLVLNIPESPYQVNPSDICGSIKMRKDGVVNIIGDVKIYDTPSGTILKDILNSDVEVFLCGFSIAILDKTSEVSVKEYKFFYTSMDHADDRINPLNYYVGEDE